MRMVYNPKPSELTQNLEAMQAFWRNAEIDALYELSTAESRRNHPMPKKLRRRADTVISRNLDRTTSRALAMNIWRADGYGPEDILTDILKRVTTTENCWRKMLAIIRAVPVTPDAPDPTREIFSPKDIPSWLLRLEKWSSAERGLTQDLKAAIAAREARPDEALDHYQWTAEDDLEAIDAVLARVTGWNVPHQTKEHLAIASARARKELKALIALVGRVRTFSIQMRTAELFADLAKRNGRKPN